MHRPNSKFQPSDQHANFKLSRPFLNTKNWITHTIADDNEAVTLTAHGSGSVGLKQPSQVTKTNSFNKLFDNALNKPGPFGVAQQHNLLNGIKNGHIKITQRSDMVQLALQ